MGLCLHLQDPPDARHTCGKVEGPLSRCGVGQTPKKGLIDEKGTGRPCFWSCQCHPLTLGLHLGALSLCLLTPQMGKRLPCCPSCRRVGGFRSAHECRSALKNMYYKEFYSLNLSFSEIHGPPPSPLPG